MTAQFRGVAINFGKECVCIDKSYQITDDEEKRKIINAICDLRPEILETRTKDNLLTEWKAHNILWQLGYKQDHTAHVDFEYKQNKWHKLGFKLITMLLREKKG